MENQEALASRPRELEVVVEGRDELNLAEFPLSAVSGRVDPSRKTLRFEDQIRDDRSGRTITRRLTISGSDEYGLPTAADDDVLLGLILLSRHQGFSDRRVTFTRYGLIRLLGWREEGKSYARIERSLNRWIGVTLYYENAWRDKAKQQWVNAKFHVLENVELVTRESGRDAGSTLSWFSWNEVIWSSFLAGNLKKLDFEFYRQLTGAITKRLYRFLDKRLFRGQPVTLNLRTLALEKVGLSRTYDIAGIKRKLRPAILELERGGFLVPEPEGARFRRDGFGAWEVTFQRTRGHTDRSHEMPGNPAKSQLLADLVARKVAERTARALVRDFAVEEIRLQLEVFDALVAQGDKRLSRNPPGFLVAAIREGYLPPKEFIPAPERKRRAEEIESSRSRSAERCREREARAQLQEQARDRAIADFWRGLPAPERLQREAEALHRADSLCRSFLNQEGSLAAASRKAALDAYALGVLRRK